MNKQPNYVFDDELYHHGIKGQKWGDRRFQNEDGSWTPEGRERYGKGGREEARAKIQYVKEKAKNLYTKVKSKVKEKTGDGLERTKDMSDDDLQKAVNRFKLQAEYNKNYELARHPNGALAKADRFFEGATGKMVRDIAVNTIPTVTNTAISKLLDSTLNKDDKLDKAAKKANINKTIADTKKVLSDIKKSKEDDDKTMYKAFANFFLGEYLDTKIANIEKAKAEANSKNATAEKIRTELMTDKYEYSWKVDPKTKKTRLHCQPKP